MGSLNVAEQIGNFYREFEKKGGTASNSQAVFDSINSITQDDGTELSTVPKDLQAVFDSLGGDASAEYILKGINLGINQFKKANGGDLPSDAVIHAAVADANAFAVELRSKLGNAVFDSAENMIHGEALSLARAQAVIVVANRIATSLPIIALLPNPTGSNEIPIIYTRTVADRDFGGTKKGDALDGKKAGSSYIINKHKFVMTSTDQLTYTVTPHVVYANFDEKAGVPDTNKAKAPFVAGRTVVYVNGQIVARDDVKANATLQSGKTIFYGVDGVVPAYAIASGSEANLDSNLITIKFSTALKSQDVVKVEVVYDYTRKDATGADYLLKAVGAEIKAVQHSIFATPSRFRLASTPDGYTQLMNELGIDALSACQLIMSAKQTLETHRYLLTSAHELAMGLGNIHPFDASRGVADGQAAAYNTTGELMNEFFKSLDNAIISINKGLDGSVSGVDVFVTDKTAVLLKRVAGYANGVTLFNASIGASDAITRIMQLSDGTNIYHIPSEWGILANDVGVGEALVIGRNTDPAKSLLIGSNAVPLIVNATSVKEFEKGVECYSRAANEINPEPRYQKQCAVIQMINLPSL